MKAIQLTNKTGMSDLYALVDDEFYPYLSQFRWHAKPGGYTTYVRRSEHSKKIYMHWDVGRLVGLELRDHISRDGLDNRLANLRPATHSQNMANRRKQKNNTSGFRGTIAATNAPGKFDGRIKFHRRNLHLGRYSTAVEAGYAYNVAARLLFGEFADLNPITVSVILNPLISDPNQLSAVQAGAIEASVTERITKGILKNPDLCQQVLQDSLQMP